MGIPEGSVVITPAQMYAQQVVTAAAVQKLEGKIDTVIEQLDQQRTEKNRVDQDHETRLRTLEKARWPLASLTVLIALGALAIGLIQMAGGH